VARGVDQRKRRLADERDLVARVARDFRCNATDLFDGGAAARLRIKSAFASRAQTA